MARDFAIIIVAGGLSGGSLLLGSGLGAFLVFVAPLPLFIVGLSRGYVSAAISVAAGAVLIAAYGAFLGAVQFILVFGSPAVWLCRLALLAQPTKTGVSWYPAGRLVVWATAMPIALFFVLLAMFAGAEGGLQSQISKLIGAVFDVLAQLQVQAPPPEAVMAVAEFFPAIAGTTWMFMILSNAIAAQAILQRWRWNIRAPATIADLELPIWLLAPLLVALAASFLPGTLAFAGRTVAILGLVPYFFLGLALIHSVVARWQGRRGALVAFYVVLVVAFGWAALLVAALGLVEQLIGLRRRT